MVNDAPRSPIRPASSGRWNSLTIHRLAELDATALALMHSPTFTGSVGDIDGCFS